MSLFSSLIPFSPLIRNIYNHVTHLSLSYPANILTQGHQLASEDVLVLEYACFYLPLPSPFYHSYAYMQPRHPIIHILPRCMHLDQEVEDGHPLPFLSFPLSLASSQNNTSRLHSHISNSKQSLYLLKSIKTPQPVSKNRSTSIASCTPSSRKSPTTNLLDMSRSFWACRIAA